MRPVKEIAVSFFIILLLVPLVNTVAVANAQTPQANIYTHDFGDTAVLNSEGTNIFAYKVIQSEQTENYGCWINGETYQCNWTIRLDYVNQEVINGSSYILFYLPTPLDKDPLYMPLNPNVTAQPVINQIQLSLTQKNGTLSAVFKPENTTGYFFGLNLRFAVYINGVNSTANLSKGACQEPGFSHTVYNSLEEMEIVMASTAAVTEPPVDSEFPYTVLILAVFAAILISTLVARKRRHHT
jgi:hypothetical protein